MPDAASRCLLTISFHFSDILNLKAVKERQYFQVKVNFVLANFCFLIVPYLTFLLGVQGLGQVTSHPCDQVCSDLAPTSQVGVTWRASGVCDPSGTGQVMSGKKGSFQNRQELETLSHCLLQQGGGWDETGS